MFKKSSMKSVIFHFCQIFILLLIPLYGVTQPSYRAEVRFRFYDKSQEISKEVMAEQYQLFNYSFGAYHLLNYRYDDSNKMHIASDNIIYNDFCLLIVHKKDTMQLILKTKGDERLKFKIDRLDFKEGIFVIDNDTSANLDFKNSKSNYYNYILSSVPKNIYNLEENLIYIELKKLKLRYGIQEDDLNPKKENELADLSGLSETLILKKYKEYLSGSDSGEQDLIDDGNVYYSPDKKIRIFVFTGESCGAHCTTFFNSFIHFNMDKKIPDTLAADFFPIDTIIKLNSDTYLVLQSGIAGGGIEINEHRIATLVQLKNNKIFIGETYTFPDKPISEKLKSISITRDTMSDDANANDFYLKFDPKTNILEYKYWRYVNEEQTQKKVYSGKLIFQEGFFRILSET